MTPFVFFNTLLNAWYATTDGLAYTRVTKTEKARLIALGYRVKP